MSIKERPLIKAVEKLGPLPAFLFANPYIAGFVAVIGCAMFGGAFLLFWIGILGGGDALEIYQSLRVGAYGGLIVGALLLVLTAFRAVDGREEVADRIKFIFGGAIGVAGFLAIDALTVEFLTQYMFNVGEVLCTSQVPGCR